MHACVAHWSFAGLDLDLEEEEEENEKQEENRKEKEGKREKRRRREEFFKPTPGCACVFGGTPASVRVTDEITPMGVSKYVPKEWDGVRRVSPGEFHELCWGGDGMGERKGEMVLLDVRNHYESRIGYFIDPRTGKEAVRPAIRRFAQWPAFVRRWVEEEGDGNPAGDSRSRDADEIEDEIATKQVELDEKAPRKIMAYCTGGIRCEKATRWMLENAPMRPGDEVYTLDGGIQAYLTWMADEIRAGRLTARDSLFKGRNYVFDARGSLGLGLNSGGGADGDAEEDNIEPVAACHMCGTPEDRLSKCRSTGCHLVLVVCECCEQEGDVRCCGNCGELDSKGARSTEGPRPICLCEMEREARLWGEENGKKGRVKGKGKGRRRGATEREDGGIRIQVKTID